MSFSEPAKTIEHIPPDFDMKKITRMRPLEQRKRAKQARHPVEPFSCEKPSKLAKAFTFIFALSIVLGALITGAWER